MSETLVLRNGDFLVRDSLTSVGDYVLTCRWDNEVLHFKISKVLVKSNETKVRGPPAGARCCRRMSFSRREQHQVELMTVKAVLCWLVKILPPSAEAYFLSG